jgi:hypothetical protein
VLPPEVASAQKDAALATNRAAAACWALIRPAWVSLRTTNRDISTSLGISAAVHAALFIVFGTTLYLSGEDKEDVPELSVQLETREGPSSEEFTEAALPKPMPEPAEDTIENPGTSAQTVDAQSDTSALPQPEKSPDVENVEEAQAVAQVPPAEGPVLTTTGESSSTVAAVTEPHPVVQEKVPETEKVMLTKNVQHLAQQLLDTNLTSTELTWQQDGQEYSARVRRQPASDSTGLEQVVAEITTNKDGKRMKTRLSMKRLAFSHFTQLVNSWDPNIQLHDDIIDGRFHSNTEIGLTFAGGVEPRFFGKATTSAITMTRNSMMTKRRSKDIFQGGIETRTERVNLPRDMPDVVNGGEPGDRQLFSENTRIIFNSDGSFVWRLANGDGPLQRATASDRPRYLIAQDDVKLYVSGTVAGIFTVYTPSDIEIENDIVYSKDPRQTLLSRDFLALISGRDIRVARTQITGTGDLNIQAALFARRKFAIESTQGGKVGVLKILGSVSAGTITETEPRYATKLDYDKRFEYLRPANFPMTRRYEVDSWDQDWEEVEAPDSAGTNQGLVRSTE